ncbi:hypothetical protein PPYR_04057 [Photinus pyralis]|uniref:Nuclear nucleic acid-binding protein C1D n=1 Tax=Photinus pyralis TaxID=7054 RepID=A0A1Y1LXV6_PHOPY|nr:nuclear nucleic acid-binding protein C1D-like [Photinus pyralis]KAB0801871.1 hypothetical protein PPYR_04057 [Photinus pyralis]
MDFGDLSDDTVIQGKLQHFHTSIDKIEELLQVTLDQDSYEKLSTQDKVDYDLFMAYALNTLYWLYLRSKGVVPNNDLKNQLNRIKQYMGKAKEAHDRSTIRPTLNQAVAKRFIKHGISASSQHEPTPKKVKM